MPQTCPGRFERASRGHRVAADSRQSVAGSRRDFKLACAFDVVNEQRD
jgi:hypothetical protein